MDRADQSDCEEGNWREKQGVVAAVLVTDQRHVHSEVVVFVSTEASLHLWHQLVDENIYQRREGERGREGEREGERGRHNERSKESVLRRYVQLGPMLLSERGRRIIIRTAYHKPPKFLLIKYRMKGLKRFRFLHI